MSALPILRSPNMVPYALICAYGLFAITAPPQSGDPAAMQGDTARLTELAENPTLSPEQDKPALQDPSPRTDQD